MRILAIETSCDETGLALIETGAKNKVKILANLLSSQIEVHRPYGGVVPNLAKREHLKNLQILWEDLTKNLPASPAGRKLKTNNLDRIAVTQGPGLAPCLWAGINFAADLAKKLKKPLVGINHLKGHIYSAFLQESGVENPKSEALNPKQISNPKFQNLEPITYNLKSITFPVLSLIVSGGHTELIFSKKIGHYQIVGKTLDDAAGEAFDKVARLLNLNYPGGPEVARLAEKGNPEKFDLPRPMITANNFDFSFSGLKTSVLYLIKGLHPKKNPLKLTPKNIADLCASFQEAVVEVLVKKTIAAAKKLKPKTLVLTGGVAANRKLREKLKNAVNKNLPHVTCHMSHVALTGDNALMMALAALAEEKILKPTDPNKMEAKPNWRIDK